MPDLVQVLDTIGLLLLLVLAYAIALIVRRRMICRNGGTFELSYRRRSGKPGRGWVLGIGRYTGQRLEWFRIFSLSPRPTLEWSRAELNYSGRREPQGHEVNTLYAGHVVVTCRSSSGTVELGMSPSSLTGFQAWLEAGPPGSSWDQRPLR